MEGFKVDCHLVLLHYQLFSCVYIVLSTMLEKAFHFREWVGIELNLEVYFVQQMSYIFHHPTVRQQVAVREMCIQGRLRVVFCFYCSVVKSCPTLCHPMDHSSPGSHPLSWSLLQFMSIELVMHLTISSSAAPFCFCLQSFPASGSFLVKSGGQSVL